MIYKSDELFDILSGVCEDGLDLHFGFIDNKGEAIEGLACRRIEPLYDPNNQITMMVLSVVTPDYNPHNNIDGIRLFVRSGNVEFTSFIDLIVRSEKILSSKGLISLLITVEPSVKTIVH